MSRDAVKEELQGMVNVKRYSKLNLAELRKFLAEKRADAAKTPALTAFFGKAAKSGSGSG
jgi:hypothetical protein